MKPVHWKCLVCGRFLSVIEEVRGNSLSQSTKCSSCKSNNKIEINGDVIKCEAEPSKVPNKKTRIR